MIFPWNDRLGHMLNLLWTHKNITAKQLHKDMQKKWDITLTQVYNLLQNLQKHQIISKKKAQVSLNIEWLQGLKQYATTATNILSTENPYKKFKTWEVRYIKAQSLSQMDSLWTNHYFKILEASKSKDLYFYNSHPVHVLCSPETEKHFLRVLASSHQIYYLIGNNFELDNFACKEIMAQWVQSVCCNTDNSFLKNGYIINIIGDFILEFYFPSVLTDYISLIFSHLRPNTDTFQKISNIYNTNYNLKIRVTKNSNSKKIKDEIIWKCSKS